jgi:hypothetical protein
MRGFEIREKGDLICVDKESMDKQKGVLVEVVK